MGGAGGGGCAAGWLWLEAGCPAGRVPPRWLWLHRAASPRWLPAPPLSPLCPAVLLCWRSLPASARPPPAPLTLVRCPATLCRTLPRPAGSPSPRRPSCCPALLSSPWPATLSGCAPVLPLHRPLPRPAPASSPLRPSPTAHHAPPPDLIADSLVMCPSAGLCSGAPLS
jgi:hypothetical protein